MRVVTFARAVWDGKQYVCVEQVAHEYDGPVAQCGGGPDHRVTAAADEQAKISAQEAATAASREARENSLYNLVKPFAVSRMKNGLPEYGDLMDFQSGPLARSYVPVRAAEGRRESMGGANMLPSGFHEANMRAIDEDEAHNFDDNLFRNVMANESVKQAGAGMLTGQQQMANPLSWYQSANQGYGNIANNQNLVSSNPLAGILGGVAQGAMSMIPV